MTPDLSDLSLKHSSSSRPFGMVPCWYVRPGSAPNWRERTLTLGCYAQNLREPRADSATQDLRLRICAELRICAGICRSCNSGFAPRMFERGCLSLDIHFKSTNCHGTLPTHLSVSIDDGGEHSTHTAALSLPPHRACTHPPLSFSLSHACQAAEPSQGIEDGTSKRRKLVRAARSGAALQHTQLLLQIPREAVPISLNPLCHISHPQTGPLSQPCGRRAVGRSDGRLREAVEDRKF